MKADFEGKKGVKFDRDSIAVTMSGDIDVMLGDTYVWRDVFSTPERKADLPEHKRDITNAANKKEVAVLMDRLIARAQAIKDAMK